MIVIILLSEFYFTPNLKKMRRKMSNSPRHSYHPDISEGYFFTVIHVKKESKTIQYSVQEEEEKNYGRDVALLGL